MKQVYAANRAEWREWLANNHRKESGIWLVFYKKHTGRPSLEYNAAVEEALCFGWIDSIIKRLDEDRYVRKFTPRKANSRWSELNKKRVKELISKGLMTKFGLKKISLSKESGLWEKHDRPQIPFEIPKELKKALLKNRKANEFFSVLAPTYQKQFIGWIAVAKRQETKDRRVKESITLLEQSKKLGLR